MDGDIRTVVKKLDEIEPELRQAFFAPFVAALTKRPVKKKAALPLQELAKAKVDVPKKNVLSEHERRIMLEEREHCLRELRIVLRDILGKLSDPSEKRFAAFLHPVNTERCEDYMQHVKNPMDISTMLEKVNAGRYRTTKAFLKDVEQIVHNTKLYYNAQPDHRGKQIVSRASELFDHAEWHVIENIDSGLRERCDQFQQLAEAHHLTLPKTHLAASEYCRPDGQRASTRLAGDKVPEVPYAGDDFERRLRMASHAKQAEDQGQDEAEAEGSAVEGEAKLEEEEATEGDHGLQTVVVECEVADGKTMCMEQSVVEERGDALGGEPALCPRDGMDVDATAAADADEAPDGAGARGAQEGASSEKEAAEHGGQDRDVVSKPNTEEAGSAAVQNSEDVEQEPEFKPIDAVLLEQISSELVCKSQGCTMEQLLELHHLFTTFLHDYTQENDRTVVAKAFQGEIATHIAHVVNGKSIQKLSG